jgi:hypothetical protein
MITSEAEMKLDVNSNLRALGDVIEDYENKWVALIERNGEDLVVGVGSDAVEAIADSKAKGFEDPILMKIPRFDVGFIPSAISELSL